MSRHITESYYDGGLEDTVVFDSIMMNGKYTSLDSPPPFPLPLEWKFPFISYLFYFDGFPKSHLITNTQSMDIGQFMYLSFFFYNSSERSLDNQRLNF